MAGMDSRVPTTRTPQTELILRTIDEGGSLTLAAQRTPTGWTRFTLILDQSPMAALLGEDAAGAPNEVINAAGPAETWEGALELLDTYVWAILHPDYVHPEFRQMVVSAVRERAADPGNACAEFVDDWLPEWERVCSAN
jgi:hypothetical protein